MRKGMFDRMPEFDSIHKASGYLRKYISPYWCDISLAPNDRGPLLTEQVKPDSTCQNLMIDGSFHYNGHIYHFLEPGYWPEKQTYICTIRKDTLFVVDSTAACAGHSVRYFGRTALVSHSDGFTLLRSDTLFRVRFRSSLPHYHGPDFEYQHFPTDSNGKMGRRVKSQFNDYKFDIPQKPGGSSAEIHFDCNTPYSLHGYLGYKGSNRDVLFLEKNGIREYTNLPEMPAEIFYCDKRLFLLFWSIGLVEITDLKQFERLYAQ